MSTKQLKTLTTSGFQHGVDTLNQTRQNVSRQQKKIDFVESEAEQTIAKRYTKDELRPIRESLPIYDFRDAIIRGVETNKNLVIVGETGSGKTTQIPQYIHEAGLSRGKKIAITQPRRVAAMTLADRVSQEFGCDLGQQVGYTIRFDDMTSPSTEIKFVTDGMLLREIQIDPLLSDYSVIILDEAHERTLNTDILFGLLKQLQEKRDDLILIVMSATLDADKFSQYLNNAPVALIPGRTYPVDVLYLSPEDAQNNFDNNETVAVTVMQIHQDQPIDGDILVFMAGSDDIETTRQILLERAKYLDPSIYPDLDIVPLYSTLPPEEQLRAFAPRKHGSRKVILSTNIAETSVTVSGVKYVIDTGLSKVKEIIPGSGVGSLTNHIISKAEAQQRTGRAGREQHGYCYRLYTEEAFDSFLPTPVPEIARIQLSNAILQLKSLNINDITSFPFIDRPSLESIKLALKELLLFSAIDYNGHITDIGRLMSLFPIDPIYARILILSAKPEMLLQAQLNPSYQTHHNTANQTQHDDNDKDIQHKSKRSKPNKHSNGTQQQIKQAVDRLHDHTNPLNKPLGSNHQGDDITIQSLPFLHCSKDMCILIAAMSVDGIAVNIPASSTNYVLRQKIELKRQEFTSPYGDMIYLYNILYAYLNIPFNRRITWCKEYYINYKKINMAVHVYQQLIELLERFNLPIISCRKEEDAALLQEQVTSEANNDEWIANICKCLSSGLFQNVVHMNSEGRFIDSHGQRVYIHPTSTLHYYIQQERRRNRDKRQQHSEEQRNRRQYGNENAQTQPAESTGTQAKEAHTESQFKTLLFHELLITKQRYLRHVCVVNDEWLAQTCPQWFVMNKAETTPTGSSVLGKGPTRHSLTHDASDSQTNQSMLGQRAAHTKLTGNHLAHSVSLGTNEKSIQHKKKVIKKAAPIQSHIVQPRRNNKNNNSTNNNNNSGGNNTPQEKQSKSNKRKRS